MEASAIKQMRVGTAVRARTPLLRVQSDERLVALVRRGHHGAFTVLVGRYETRLFAFCRHLLRSREDAEDVLQEVFASAFKAMMADDRPIKVRPWLYRIARNRCLNHLRRCSAIGVDSIEDHVSEHGPSTSDTVQSREDLWLLVDDIRGLPESQRSALLLREMEALSYEQIAEVLDKTVPSVKSLLIRARRALAECSEARGLICTEVMVEIGEWRLGTRDRLSKVIRRHVDGCVRCQQLPTPDERALPAVRAWLPLPLVPLALLKALKLPVAGTAKAGSTATATATATAAGSSAGAAAAGSTTAGLLSAGVSGLVGKAAVSLTAVALGVGGAVVVETQPRTSVSPRQTAPLVRGAVPTAPSDAPAAAIRRRGSAPTVHRGAAHAIAAAQTAGPAGQPTAARSANGGRGVGAHAAAMKLVTDQDRTATLITAAPGTMTSIPPAAPPAGTTVSPAVTPATGVTGGLLPLTGGRPQTPAAVAAPTDAGETAAAPTDAGETAVGADPAAGVPAVSGTTGATGTTGPAAGPVAAAASPVAAAAGPVGPTGPTGSFGALVPDGGTTGQTGGSGAAGFAPAP